MKKIIFFMLCIILALSTLTVSYASAPEVDVSLYERAADTLASVGVVDKAEYKTWQDYITYRGYLEMVCNITGGSLDGTAKLYGVDKAMYNEVIKYDDAVKIAVELLGWQYKAADRGYMSVADSLGLNKGVLNPNDNFSKYDAVIIMYNALYADFLNQTGYGSTNTYSSKNMSLLGVYRDIYKFDGILEANKWTSVYKTTGTDRDNVIIIDEDLGVLDMDCTSLDPIDLIGCEVEGFYRQDGNKRELLCIYNASEELALTSDMYPEYSPADKTITYTYSGKTKTVTVPATANVFVNGKKHNDITYINNGGAHQLECVKLYKYDGKYNCIHIYTYTDHVAQKIGKKGYTIGFMDSSDIKFEPDDVGDTLFFFNGNGETINLPDISVGNVITIYKSFPDEDGKMLVRVYAYESSFLGMVTSVENNGCDDEYLIKEYSVDADGNITYSEERPYIVANGTDCNIEIGNPYKFYTDMNSKIVYANGQKNNGRLAGLYIKIGSKDEGLNKNVLSLMLIPDLDSDLKAEAKIVPVYENATVEYEKPDKTRAKARIKNTDLAELNSCLMHTAMYYYVNSSGEITRIVGYSSTPQDGLMYNFNPDGIMLGTCNVDDNGFAVAKYYSSNASRYGGIDSIDAQSIVSGNPDTYYGKYHIRYGTKVKKMLLLPLVKSPDEITRDLADNYYKTVNAIDYGYACNRSYAYYNGFSNDGGLMPDYSTIEYDPYKPSSGVMNKMFMLGKGFLINKVSRAKSENGNEVYKLEGYFGSNAKTFYSVDSKIIDLVASTSGTPQYFDEISEGDILAVQLDGNGDISLAVKLCDYDPETGNITLPAATDYFRTYYDEVAGKLVDDTYSEAEGFYNISMIATRRFGIVAYPYQITKSAYAKSMLSVSYVVDRNKLLNAKDPYTDPEQYVYKYLNTGSACLYFDTTLKTDQNRVGKYTMYSAPSFFRDPSCQNRVFMYIRSSDIAYTVVYKK